MAKFSLNKLICPYVVPLPTVAFTAPADLDEDVGVQTGLGGGLPTGGIYSGPGVTDDGNGLDASIKDIPSIFEKGITTTPGSGLGLYHSKQLISEMGGSISAEIGEKRDIKFKLEFAQ